MVAAASAAAACAAAARPALGAVPAYAAAELAVVAAVAAVVVAVAAVEFVEVAAVTAAAPAAPAAPAPAAVTSAGASGPPGSFQRGDGIRAATAALPKPVAKPQPQGPAVGSQAPTAQAAVDTAKLGLAAGSPALQPQQAVAPTAQADPTDPTAPVNPMSGKRVAGNNQPAAESTTFANAELSRIISLVHHR